MPSVVSPTIGRANARKRKPIAMNVSAMPASVERSAARGVACRTRSANGAQTSSITPEPRHATRPACHATRAGSAAPAASATSFAGSMIRKTCANSETVLMP